jgi:hypothetical protein
MPRLQSILIPLGLIWLPTVVLGADQGGAISGVVLDDKGAPVSNALVLYRSVQSMVRSANGHLVATGPLLGSGVKTGADGKFAVGGLPAATYHLCAYGSKNTDLGSCEWVQGTMRVDLAAGQTAQVNLQIAEGTLLTFQVQDPKQQVVDLESLRVASGKPSVSAANFAIGVWAGTRYARATLVSTTGATRRYQLAIPKTAAVRLYLDTSLHVLDGSAMSLPVRAPSTTLAAAGQAEVITYLTIP